MQYHQLCEVVFKFFFSFVNTRVAYYIIKLMILSLFKLIIFLTIIVIGGKLTYIFINLLAIDVIQNTSVELAIGAKSQIEAF